MENNAVFTVKDLNLFYGEFQALKKCEFIH